MRNEAVYAVKTSRQLPIKDIAVSKAYYYGYKLHLITSVRGVLASMDMSKTSVYDLSYLTDIKYSNLSNCRLIGDKGYLSKDISWTCFLRAISGWKHQKEVIKKTKNHLNISLRSQESELELYCLNYATSLCSNTIMQKQIWAFLFYSYQKLQQ